MRAARRRVLDREDPERQPGPDAGQPARLRLNTFYFPGWTLTVDGGQRAIDYSNPQGTIEFVLGPGQHAVQFRFGDTPIRWWSTIISLLTLLGALLALWMARKHKGVTA